jgi:hypothetical protein
VPGRRKTPHQQAVDAKLRSLRVEREARLLLQAENARDVELPPHGHTLADDLAEPDEHPVYVIEDLQTYGGNAVLIAEKKTGKTTLAMNVVASLAENASFLGRFAVMPLEGRVAFLNYELDREQMRRWWRDFDLSSEAQKKIIRPLHLRGRRFPFWLPYYEDKLCNWLRTEEAEWIVIDTFTRAWRGYVVNENDNTAVGAFVTLLDDIKTASDVRHLLGTAHTGRTKVEEGHEHSRGAIYLEDWLDQAWYLTQDGSRTRSLRAMGRDVPEALGEAFDLSYDDRTRRYSASGQSRTERRDVEGVQRVLQALIGVLTISPTTSPTSLPTTTAVKEAMAGAARDRDALIRKTIADGYMVRLHPNGDPVNERADNERKKLLCRPTDTGLACYRNGSVQPVAAGRKGGRRRTQIG